ncbi:HET-C-related protein [Bacillus marinisedimentorum]|uniref:HET-C-related protein n=1 Tax=Bacillus marinisedimentorum TaxID=1821260 RepID=UPI00087257FA|nr:HET-C-related protein [Bacillus marinisedimentorum]
MNTHGHEDVAKTAGIPLLEEAIGKNNRSIHAFYLGNWLTDVSQAVDPVAYAASSNKIKQGIESSIKDVKNSINAVLDEVVSTIYEINESAGDFALKSLKPDIDPYLKGIKSNLHNNIDFLFKAQNDERNSRVAKFFRDAFLITGYFKFVHPDSSTTDQRLDFDCFMSVFGRPNNTRGSTNQSPADDRPGAYTQYYPFEHLDRPEILPSQNPSIYAPGKQTPKKPFRVASGKKAGTRSPRNKKRIDPDLYSYLRDDIEMTAGLLSEVDLAFKNAFKKGIKEDDPDWNITLAKLGHALHQVEDFFAHSNWVELAAKRLGSYFISGIIPPKTDNEMIDRTYTTYKKRLKRHLTAPLSDWSKHPDEDWVVTGYFDFKDTILSLAHLTEELWGGKVPDPYAKGHQLFQSGKKYASNPSKIEQKIQKTIRDTLEFINNPKQAVEDEDNKIAQKYKKKYGTDIKNLRKPTISRLIAVQVARETTYLNKAPTEVQEAFLNVIVEGSRAYSIHKLSKSLYEAITDITAFVTSPIAFLQKWLPEKFKKILMNAFKFYAKERFYEWIGSGRIGCHSLLAKDHGTEPFYKKMRECSVAVHWYIVKTMLRWKDDEDADYIDWLELLEYFLRNPLPPKKGYRAVKGYVPVTIVHTVQHKEQLKATDRKYSLEDKYKKSAMEPDQFTWRTIADANFNTYGFSLKKTQTIINHTLRNSVWGVPVAPPNYAFKKGVSLLIPQQKAAATFFVPIKDDNPWFTEVLNKGWKVFRGYDDPENNQSVEPLKHHAPIKISLNEVKKIISRGKKLRMEARKAYRPTNAK